MRGTGPGQCGGGEALFLGTFILKNNSILLDLGSHWSKSAPFPEEGTGKMACCGQRLGCTSRPGAQVSIRPPGLVVTSAVLCLSACCRLHLPRTILGQISELSVSNQAGKNARGRMESSAGNWIFLIVWAGGVWQSHTGACLCSQFKNWALKCSTVSANSHVILRKWSSGEGLWGRKAGLGPA